MLKLLFAFFLCAPLFSAVQVGVDVLLQERPELLAGKKIALITNHTAINSSLESTLDLLKSKYRVTCVFAPEHGLNGDQYAEKEVVDGTLGALLVYSLHGKTRRPTEEMLKGIDVLVYDIQDIGSRSYTYISTLFYCMEEAAKRHIKIVVLDRPNPMGGLVVDGPLLEEKWRSFVGYINVPYVHGMTVGELAQFFNEEYGVQAHLEVVPMKGWKREMTFEKTGLTWVPTSPQIPEGDTPFFYPATGLIGNFSLVSIGIGYTLPFKVIGAPWIEATHFAETLNRLKLAGVTFCPFYFRPFFGKFKNESCQGVTICITDKRQFLPFTTQYAIIGVLKALYPKRFNEAISNIQDDKTRLEMLCKLNGGEEIFRIISQEPYFIWKLRERFQKEREHFVAKRRKYLIYN